LTRTAWVAPMDLKEEAILGAEAGSHWYYASKGRALLDLLKGLKLESLLDVGAGSGIFSRQLIDAGVCQRALCVDPGYEVERVERHNGHEIRFARAIDRPSADLVLMMDVLEHVDDDVGLLRSYTRNLEPEDLVAISVPAFQFLWSGHDEFLEHRRRYSKRQIEAVVRAAGLEPVKSGYFFGLLFPVAVAARLIDRWTVKLGLGNRKSSLARQGRTLNRLLIALHDLERKVVFPVNGLAGLTVFCLARRPG